MKDRPHIAVSYSRGTLGVEGGRPESCSACGTHGQVSRINIDGIWSYLCDDCFRTLWELHLDSDPTETELRRLAAASAAGMARAKGRE